MSERACKASGRTESISRRATVIAFVARLAGPAPALAPTMVLALALAATAPARAQLVPPPPPATPPTAFTPPEPPAPPPPPKAPEPELGPIDLVKLDAEGKLIPLGVTPEEAAVRVLVSEQQDAAVKASLEKLLSDRAGQVEQKLADNASSALQVRAQLGLLDSASDIAPLKGLGDLNRSLLVAPGVLDALAAQRLLPPSQVQRARKAAEDYRKVVNRENKARAGDDVQRLVVESARSAIRSTTAEPMRQLNRMLAAAGAEWPATKAGLSLTPAQLKAMEPGEQALTQAKDDAARAEAMAQVLGALEPAQQSLVLSAVALPAPEAPAAPAAPASPAGN